MAPKKAPKAPKTAKPAAAEEKAKAEKPHVYRVDLGESLPPQAPFPRADMK